MHATKRCKTQAAQRYLNAILLISCAFPRHRALLAPLTPPLRVFGSAAWLFAFTPSGRHRQQDARRVARPGSQSPRTRFSPRRVLDLL